MAKSPASRRTTNARWLQAYDPIATKPGDGQYHTCRILVPYAHRLHRAIVSFTDIDVVSATVALLVQADDTDAKAGTAVGSIAVLTADADLVSVQELTLAESDRLTSPANRVYALRLNGADAGDFAEQPVLAILVEPAPRPGL